jgi:hypothetical protein
MHTMLVRVNAWRRSLQVAAVVLLAGVAAASAQSGLRTGPHRTDIEYDGRFAFVRLRWGGGGLGGFGGFGFRGMSNAWNHDYPRAEQHLALLLRELTYLDARTDGSRILSLDDPELFRYPIAYMWEPGFWTLTDHEAERFRAYLLKGGFAIFDDFDHEHLDNLEANMQRVLPDARFIEIDETNQVFDVFFRMKTIYFPDPRMNIRPTYYGIYEDNDPTRRLMVIANHNADVAEYWEWSGTTLLPVDDSNEAYKLGINYFIYGLTH